MNSNGILHMDIPEAKVIGSMIRREAKSIATAAGRPQFSTEDIHRAYEILLQREHTAGRWIDITNAQLWGGTAMRLTLTPKDGHTITRRSAHRVAGRGELDDTRKVKYTEWLMEGSHSLDTNFEMAQRFGLSPDQISGLLTKFKEKGGTVRLEGGKRITRPPQPPIVTQPIEAVQPTLPSVSEHQQVDPVIDRLDRITTLLTELVSLWR